MYDDKLNLLHRSAHNGLKLSRYGWGIDESLKPSQVRIQKTPIPPLLCMSVLKYMHHLKQSMVAPEKFQSLLALLVILISISFRSKTSLAFSLLVLLLVVVLVVL